MTLFQFEPGYLSAERVGSYAFAYALVRRWVPIGSSICEIGSGPGILAHMLRVGGYHVETIDSEPGVNPTLLADVRELEVIPPCDAVLALQVLEHMDYSECEKVLGKLAAGARNCVIISVPDSRPAIRFSARIPRIGTKTAVLSLPFLGRTGGANSHGHLWEIGWQGVPVSRVNTSLRRLGMRVVWSERFETWPYHHFFVAQKSERVFLESCSA